MVSKEEYKKYVKDLVGEDNKGHEVKYLTKSYKNMSSVLVTLGVISFSSTIFFFMCGAGNIGIFSILMGIFLIIFGAGRTINTNSASRYYKKNYRAQILDYLLKGYEYSFSPESKISRTIFKESQFGGYFEDYEGSDKLTINIPNDDGSKSGCYLNLCDLNVTKTVEDSDGDTRTVTVYKGAFGYVEFPFEFKCILCIDSDYKMTGKKLKGVTLEDIVFNKKFMVISDDQIESRYILTPTMMEKLLFVEGKLHGMKLTLVENRMYIGFSHIDLFELSGIEGTDVENAFDAFYDEIGTILKIVEEIKTNNKIFKM